MKKLIVPAILFVAASVLAHMHVAIQKYHPIVKVASPDGLMYTAVQDATAERRACGAANERFLRPLKEGCKDCKIVQARCERAIEGALEAALSDGSPIPYPRIISTGVRVAITGPMETAKLTCDFIARDLAKRGGERSAVCVNADASARKFM